MRSFLYKNISVLASVALVLALSLGPVLPALAASGGSVNGSLSPGGSVNGGLSTGGSVNGNTSSGGSVSGANCGNSSDGNTLQNPLQVCSISDLIALLLHAAIIIGIPIAVLFIVYAGFKFILARGSPGELSEARSNLVATLIGVAIFVGASLIANVIIATLQQLGVNGINSY